MILIVSGNRREAEYCAQEMRIPKDRWRYVHNHIDIQGHRDPDVIFVGRYYLNTNLPAIEEVLRMKRLART